MHITFAFLFATTAAVISCNAAICASAPPASSTQYWITQPVDHFGGAGGATWQQQYLVNATFYRPGGPIYVSTPGESPVNARYIDKSHFTSLAQRTNGLLVTMEHRYFGASNPMPDLSGASLRFLTIENALADFAAFIRVAKRTPSSVFPIPVVANARVIFGGGSYSGNVAAWMRAKYPDLVLGAWASSAIVYGRLQNYQFDLSFGRHLAQLGCAQRVSQAVSEVDAILLSNNSTQLASMQAKFGIPALSASDSAGLLAALITIYSMTPVTTAGDYLGSGVCSFFGNTTITATDAYAAAVRSTIQQAGLTQQALIQIGDSSLGIDNYALGQVNRVWYYMSCTWFGNWQIAPPRDSRLKGYRSQLVNMAYFQTNCPKKFGSGVPVPVDVAAYNRKWFSNLYGVSNVFYTGGSLDIWRDTTITTSYGTILPPARGSLAVLIDGATHAQDLGADSPSDLASVRRARSLGDALVINQWLA
ncbi:hypothetical protein GGI03_007853 [Coemansia sp. RSA 2337]|nr:hypothetical protein H4S03_007789 [Coemansia sp. S3946]KAJ2065932.1 hypothetical protein GGH13_005918 [Coemansia sp. S155-1]KAJ2097444.1 hypothetical protein IW146_010187 [Coemansia sp. RSA 922]KAJ2444324.1 hypothetical protein GGI03_007853 [Coemansia sp. RSA 2337]